MNHNNNSISADNTWMQHAIQLAKHAAVNNEIPVGAVIVLNQEIIGSGFNQPISTKDPSAHAEIIALRAAAKKLNNYRLIDTTLYVTLEPCLMCAGAMIHARIKRLVFGALDNKNGAISGPTNLFATNDKWNHKIQWEGGILADQCATLLQDFFKQRR